MQAVAADLAGLFDWVPGAFAWAPAWLVSLFVFVVAIAVALVAHRLLYNLLKRLAGDENLFRRSLVRRTEGLARLALIAVAVSIAANLSPLNLPQTRLAQTILTMIVVLLIAWMVSVAVHVWITLYLRRFTRDSTDQFLKRKHVTQTHILQRVAVFIVWLTGIGVALMTFDGVRQLGISILASAGAAGLILGLALQPVLQNLLAGIQIAVTQPVRIGDALIVENEYGTVEDIRATYVVIRLWDLRRLVIPLSYFLEKPFQNWTRDSTELLGSVMVYLDYSVPIAKLRESCRKKLETLEKWDGKVFAVQVTDFRDNVMEVRVLMSSSDSAKLFDLRCEMREAIVTMLQRDYPEALPRLRALLEPDRRSAGTAGGEPLPATSGSAAH